MIVLIKIYNVRIALNVWGINVVEILAVSMIFKSGREKDKINAIKNVIAFNIFLIMINFRLIGDWWQWYKKFPIKL